MGSSRRKRRDILAKHQSSKEDEDELSLLLKSFSKKGQGPPINIGELFKHYDDYDHPLDALEKDYLTCKLLTMQSRYSLNEAAKILGLSSQTRFERLLKRHGLYFTTKKQFKNYLRSVNKSKA